ncbi:MULTISPECIES: hypothetical protein [Streptomyces]|nr:MULTISPECIES: hypothetical protein [Streptomyces]
MARTPEHGTPIDPEPPEDYYDAPAAAESPVSWPEGAPASPL